MIGRTRHLTSPIWSRIDWYAGSKIRIAGLSFAELEMDKTGHLKLYLLMPERSEHQLNKIFQFTNSLKINLISMD